MIKAPVNKIIPSSVVDGPGNRTAVFFQSCNFNCRYCHNPETINMCISCGACVKTCPVGALSIKDGKVAWDEKKCCGCDTCIKTCQHNASPKITYMSGAEIWEKIKDNLPFIRGLTVSGGECTLQAPVVRELFTIAKQHGLGTLLDSNGSYDFEKDSENLLPVSDGVMLDVKADNEERHMWLTNHSIDIVLHNLEYLASVDKLEEIRTVCIPGSLENEKTIQVVADILKPYLEKKAIRYKLIKYRHIGVREQYRNFREPDEAYMNSLKKLAEEKGFRNIVII
ncbi:MAG: YjjW family glycine radical enzyme activase [Erysipelotrichaceae bacterium]|nr:YjjW family glycine radical enzyme activase [Erysipelotrichaceae bacterium]